jgi:hypothetical protein
MLARVAAEIAALPEPRGPMRRLCGDLARRIRLLAPLLQHLQDRDLDDALRLADALGAARDLLRAVHDGSKIYQVRAVALLAPQSNSIQPMNEHHHEPTNQAMQGDAVLQRFATVNSHIHLALDALPYKTFDLPEEVLEQVPTQAPPPPQ